MKRGNETTLREHRKKARVSSLLIFHSLHASFPSCPTASDCPRVHSPGRYRVKWTAARGMLPAEVEFLLFVSGVSNNAISKGGIVPFARPLCGEWGTKSAGCCGNKTQERKKLSLSTSPGHKHICQHRNKLPETQPKTRLGFNMGFRPWESRVYILDTSEFPSSELQMQMRWAKPDICISAIHSFLINLYDQMTNRLMSHRSCILFVLVQELNIHIQNSSPKPIGKKICKLSQYL